VSHAKCVLARRREDPNWVMIDQTPAGHLPEGKIIMDFSKLSTNNWIAGGGGLGALIALFLPWYGADFGFDIGFSINGWNAGFFAWFGSLLAVAAGGIIVAKVLDVADIKVANLTSEQLAMVVGATGAAFVLLRFVTAASATKFGLWLGILSAGAAVAGAYLTAKDAGVGIPTADDFKATKTIELPGTVPGVAAAPGHVPGPAAAPPVPGPAVAPPAPGVAAAPPVPGPAAAPPPVPGPAAPPAPGPAAAPGPPPGPAAPGNPSTF